MTDIRAIWKKLSSEKKLTRGDVATLCIYKALKKGVPEAAKAYLVKSFKPVTNVRKLSNGAYPYYGMYNGLADINGYRPSVVFQLLTPEEQAEVSAVVSAIKGRSYGEVSI